jgi:hypothetical protein
LLVFTKINNDGVSMKNLILFITLLFSILSFAEDNTVTLAFDVDTTRKSTDILFIVDNSGSMGDNQSKLANFSAEFIDALGRTNYNLYAVTTDTTDLYTANIINWYNSNPALELISLLSSFGTNGAHTELVYDNLLKFVTSPKGVLFNRSQVPLEVIVLTDEEEQSWISSSELVGKMSYKKNFVVSTIIPRDGNCEGNWGPSEYSKFIEILTLTSGSRIDLCKNGNNFKNDYLDLAAKIKSRAEKLASSTLAFSKIKLMRTPNLETMVISYGTQIIKKGGLHTGWIFDEDTNTIHFGKLLRLIQRGSTKKLIITFAVK